MRKLTFLLAVAAVAAANTGCVGRCKNWFSKGSPCGTLMSSPAVLSAPVAMGPPIMQQQPICIQQAPMCMPACDPCMQYDPCATTGGVSTGYFGGYVSGGADCECAPAAGTVMQQNSVTPGGQLVPYPAPQ